MAKAKTTPKASPKNKPALLGPGLFAGFVELRTDRSFRVRLTDDRRIAAKLSDAVDPGLVEDCLRQGRMVIVADTAAGPAILGALQTSRQLTMEPDGTLSIEAKALRLVGEKAVSLECGPVSLRMESKGTLRTEGDRMVIDMSSNVRVLSALVELP